MQVECIVWREGINDYAAMEDSWELNVHDLFGELEVIMQLKFDYGSIVGREVETGSR